VPAAGPGRAPAIGVKKSGWSEREEREEEEEKEEDRAAR
jgi:hypothetical protein